jgi:hypothetical protein
MKGIVFDTIENDELKTIMQKEYSKERGMICTTTEV